MITASPAPAYGTVASHYLSQRHTPQSPKVRSMLEAVNEIVSPSFHRSYGVGSLTTLSLLLGTTLLVLVGSVVLLVYDLFIKRALPVARVSNTLLTPPAFEREQKWHAFISHVWLTGQDQVRGIKQLLREVVPGIRIFLDVDDLVDIDFIPDEVRRDNKHSFLKTLGLSCDTKRLGVWHSSPKH